MRIGHASIDERKKISGGKAGDQTKKEVCIRSYYDKNWDYVIRAKDKNIAERQAVACEIMCNDDHIGYDQMNRNDLIALLEALKWDYTKISRDTECDCSSFMTACALCAGAKIDYKGNAPTTRSMVTRFRASGAYEITPFVSPKHNNLKRGDILVKQGSHTVMVLDDYVQNIPSKSIDQIAKEVIAGKYGDGEERKKAIQTLGYDYEAVRKKVNEILRGY